MPSGRLASHKRQNLQQPKNTIHSKFDNVLLRKLQQTRKKKLFPSLSGRHWAFWSPPSYTCFAIVCARFRPTNYRPQTAAQNRNRKKWNSRRKLLKFISRREVDYWANFFQLHNPCPFNVHTQQSVTTPINTRLCTAWSCADVPKDIASSGLSLHVHLLSSLVHSFGRQSIYEVATCKSVSPGSGHNKQYKVNLHRHRAGTDVLHLKIQWQKEKHCH